MNQPSSPSSRTDLRTAASAAVPRSRMQIGGPALVALLALGMLGLQMCGASAPPAPTNTTPPPPTLTITTTSLPSAASGTGYSAALAASGGVAPVSWTLAGGALPNGLVLSSGGVLSGMPSAVGDFNITVQATDSGSSPSSTTAKLLLIVDSSAIALSAPRVSPAAQGGSYTDGDDVDGAATGGAVVAISGGSGPYTCSLTSGTLPVGMSLAAVTPATYPAGLCVVSGTPTQAGEFPLTVQVQDKLLSTASQAVTFNVLSSRLPAVTNWTATAVSPTQEAITWTTSAPASSKVCFSVGYAVNTCTPETDTAGVISHSVGLTGLWPSTSYQYFIESRGIANGAPQDYLAATETQNCCADSFVTQAADATSVPTIYVDPAGPHNVVPGYPLIVGLYYGPTQGKNGNANPQFVITGLPPNSKVHWPDQQDNGLTQGHVSTTTTPDDTITFSGLGSNGTTQFELLTNVGGVTPAGQYTLKINGNVFGSSSTPLTTAESTWSVGVATPTFVGARPTAFPAIPDLALWQSDMTAPWPTGSGETMGDWFNGQQRGGACEFYTDQQGIQFYDGAWVYDQIGIYTGDLPLWTAGSGASPCPASAGGNGPQGAAAPLALYHQFLVADSYNVGGFWVFPHGLYYACTAGGDAQACADLHGLANGVNGSLLANYTAYFDATNARESCYALGLRRLDYDAGGGRSTLAQVQQLATQCLGHVDNIVNGTTGFEESFMDGLISQALIEYYLDPKTGNHADPRIPPALEALADHLWSTNWVPRAGNNGLFIYNLIEQNNGLLTNTGGDDLRNLNLLIAPLYAWLYEQTGKAIYQEEGDAIWDSGVNDVPGNGIGWSGKNFSQQYRWSFDYALWRSK